MDEDDRTLNGLNLLLLADWRITMSRHPDQSLEAPDPGAIVCTVWLRRRQKVISASASTLLEALREAKSKAGEEPL